MLAYYPIEPYADIVIILSAGNEWLKPGAWGSITEGPVRTKSAEVFLP
jgi:hypothetical protein